MNDAFVMTSLALVAMIVGGSVLGIQWYRKRAIDSVYQRLADRFGGHYEVCGLWNQPSLYFVHEFAYVRLEVQRVANNHSRCFTQLKMSWPDSHFRCEVYPASFLTRAGHLLGMRDVEIGSPEFDDDYVITGNDVSELKAFLRPAVQDRLNLLRSIGIDQYSFRLYLPDDLPAAGDIYFSASGGQLLFKKRGFLREFSVLERYVSLCLDIYNLAIKASAEGIEFVEPKLEASLNLSDAVCQICGEMVKLDAVFCRGCKTPHHKDCWEYYGACSTYGCGQRKYVVRQFTGAFHAPYWLEQKM